MHLAGTRQAFAFCSDRPYARNKNMNMNSPEKKCQFQFRRYGASPVCILLGDVVNDVAQDEIKFIH